jgi:predicted DNA-binding protein
MMTLSERVIVRITDEQAVLLKELAKEAGVTLSDYLRRIIQKDIDESFDEY